MPRTILCPEWIIDGTGTPPLTGHAAIVADGLIQAVTPVGEVQPGASDRVVRLPQATLLPGLINNHVHTVLPGDGTPFPDVQFQSDAALTLQAVHNIQAALSGGVTTVRDCGARGTIVTQVRDAQARGLIQGARVISCAWPVTITGGHERYFGGEADGENAVQTMVRRIVSAGADFIKVIASGGGTPGTLPHYPSYSVSELRVISEVARSLGRKVSAHCSNTLAIAGAVEAGCDLIEHAIFADSNASYHFDPGVARKIVEAGIHVTPTLQIFRDMADALPDGPEQDRWRRMRDDQRDIARQLHDLGVTLLAGSDAGWRATTFDTFWKELDELVVAGLSPVEAIHAATGAVSRAFGFDKQFGAIQPGLLADLVVVAGDASRDIRCVAHVQAVYQAGLQVFSAL